VGVHNDNLNDEVGLFQLIRRVVCVSITRLWTLDFRLFSISRYVIIAIIDTGTFIISLHLLVISLFGVSKLAH
jgi:hypothetical protein